MIQQKKPWFESLARKYVQRKLKSSFSDLRLIGEDTLRNSSQSSPLLIACNHVAWWDPLVLLQLAAHFDWDAYCYMDAEQLKKLPFFAWVGAVPLRKDSFKNSWRDLMAAKELVKKPGQVLFQARWLLKVRTHK